jgi:hypothetical protein
MQQQQLLQQPGATVHGMDAVPVPHVAADPSHMDRVALPQVSKCRQHCTTRPYHAQSCCAPVGMRFHTAACKRAHIRSRLSIALVWLVRGICNASRLCLQSAAMYQVPPAQQYAQPGEVPYMTDAYQAVMGSAPMMQVCRLTCHMCTQYMIQPRDTAGAHEHHSMRCCRCCKLHRVRVGGAGVDCLEAAGAEVSCCGCRGSRAARRSRR